MMCRRIALNLRHRNKETLNPHSPRGQPRLAHGGDRYRLWWEPASGSVIYVTFVFPADSSSFQGLAGLLRPAVAA